ncbi:NAD kinase [Thioalkalivibrio nitratireducens DSM 14787]|uniref:NAD kinase n=1 Tax=Thioalkalivibrio nitratireducens (strain DSM 14787 / UNIQEM 213 / ALEN2) TaxID=1255043 RepID=L0E2A7_THIND|nr:NAD(+) kinase [Thioalkalivibrio nitratireducens]AGA34791.1 NAD kinase [Thioalkalivibrio nitratireducens DSM 14787]
MQATFSTIGLVGKANDSRTAPLVSVLVDALHQRGLGMIIEQGIGDCEHPSGCTVAPLAELAPAVDLIIVIGGDGTLLATARATAEHGTPMLGINLGRLGFLVDVLPDRAATELNEVLDGAYEIEPRAMLQTTLLRDGSPIHHGLALNDAVLHVQSVVRIIEFDTFIDGLDVGRLRADGLIIATPTGSTAYALSAGGPILTPELEAMVVVPVCPHSLNHRPLVVSGRAVIEIKLSSASRSPAQVALDGQENLDFAPGDVLRVERRAEPLTLVHPRHHHFLRMLRSKLRWGEHP